MEPGAGSSTLERRIVSRLVADLSSALASRLRHVALFGSRARRDHRPNSDFDLLVVVDRRRDDAERRVHELAMACELEEGVPISTVILDEASYRQLFASQRPFWRSFREEAVELWPPRM